MKIITIALILFIALTSTLIINRIIHQEPLEVTKVEEIEIIEKRLCNSPKKDFEFHSCDIYVECPDGTDRCFNQVRNNEMEDKFDKRFYE